MKILHIISSGGMYGAEAVILNLSRVLNQGSHRSSIGVFANSSNLNVQLHEQAAAEGIESNLIQCRGQVDSMTFNEIRDLVARIKPDIVHAHGYKADIYVYLALRRLRIPLVSTCHTWYDNNLTLSLYGSADRVVLRRFARVIAVSSEVKQRLLKAGVRPQNIAQIQNGIDLRPFDNVSPSLREALAVGDAPVIGLVGRLSTEKGVDIFLRAAARVLPDFPRARFVVIGEGPDRHELESLIDELGIRQNVTMVGRRNDMPAVYASFDLMVSASRKEGLPIALLEGMASGLPLVATSAGEIPAIVQHGMTGLLVPAEDADLLASAITELLQDPDRRRQFGAAGRQRIETEFSAQRMTADYLRAYQAVLRGKTK